MLPDFQSEFENFGTLCMKGLKWFLSATTAAE